MTGLDSAYKAARFGHTRLVARAVVTFIATTALMTLSVEVVGAQAATGPNRYLFKQSDLSKLGFALPPPPPAPPAINASTPIISDLETLKSIADLEQVKAAQEVDAPAKAEAFADADAYISDALMPRFSIAAGRNLSITRRPILAHILRWLVQDVDFYKIKETKGADGKAYLRARPFIIDPSITPCNQSYMTFPALPNQSDSSYPSGHAAHGYIAGLLLSSVMKDRGGVIVARGVRYGTNRIICGVHFPTDVLMGQAYARFIFDKAIRTDAFRKDRDCAVEEDWLDRIGNLPERKPDPKTGKIPPSTFSVTCQSLDAQYYKESLT